MKTKYLLSFLAAATLFACDGRAATSAEEKIRAAEQVLRSHPEAPQARLDLASALCRRARESGNPGYFDQAERALQQSPVPLTGNYDAQKLHVDILLGKRDYATALRAAGELNKRVPDDIPVWGMLADAHIGLGDYAEAEKAVQWMLDLRPGNAPALVHAAGLRELFGDVEGAIDLVEESLRRTPETEVEETAALMTAKAHLQIVLGEPKRAEDMLNQALLLFPAYPAALREMALLRMARKDFEPAIALLSKRQHELPVAVTAYDLAEALQSAGNTREADTQFAKFASLAASEGHAPLDLVFYYADHAGDAPKALALAQREKSLRHDVYTQDALAWALYRSGQYSQAKTELDQALKVGVQEPLLFCHASRIAAALEDHAAEAKYQEQASRGYAFPCASAMAAEGTKRSAK